jgi:hypothetical protein
VGAEDGLSQELLRRLFAVAREEYGATFETLRELAGEIEAGTVPVLRRI